MLKFSCVNLLPSTLANFRGIKVGICLLVMWREEAGGTKRGWQVGVLGGPTAHFLQGPYAKDTC